MRLFVQINGTLLPPIWKSLVEKFENIENGQPKSLYLMILQKSLESVIEVNRCLTLTSFVLQVRISFCKLKTRQTNLLEKTRLSSIFTVSFHFWDFLWKFNLRFCTFLKIFKRSVVRDFNHLIGF